MRGLALLALVGGVLAGCGGSDKPSARQPRPAAPKAPANTVLHVPVGGNPAAITSGLGRVWTIGHRNGVLYVIDPSTGRVTKRVTLGGIKYTGLAAGHGAVWAFRDDTQSLLKIDPKTLRLAKTSRLGTALTALTPIGDTLWAIAPEEHALVEVDPATMKISKRVKLPAPLASGDMTPPSERGGALWVGGYRGIARVDPDSGRILATVRAADQVSGLAATPSGVYFIYPNSTQLMRVKVRGGRPVRVGRASAQPGLLQLVEGKLILTDDAHVDVVRFDPTNGKALARLRLRGDVKLKPGQFAETINLTGVAAAGGALWFSDWAANAVHRVPLAKLGG
jgi:streptogramin lyase